MKKKTFLVSALSAFLLVLSACNGAVIDSSSSGSKSDSSASSSQPTTSSGGGGGGGTSSIAPSSSDEPTSSSQEESSSEEQPSSSQEESSSSESGSSSSEVVTQYTITYSAGEGTGTMNPVVVDAGSEHTLFPCGFTREGYHFDYWQVGNDATHRDPGYQFTVNGNVTITAQWEENEPPVSTAFTITMDEAPAAGHTVLGYAGGKTEGVFGTVTGTVNGNKITLDFGADPTSKYSAFYILELKDGKTELDEQFQNVLRMSNVINEFKDGNSTWFLRVGLLLRNQQPVEITKTDGKYVLNNQHITANQAFAGYFYYQVRQAYVGYTELDSASTAKDYLAKGEDNYINAKVSGTFNFELTETSIKVDVVSIDPTSRTVTADKALINPDHKVFVEGWDNDPSTPNVYVEAMVMDETTLKFDFGSDLYKLTGYQILELRDAVNTYDGTDYSAKVLRPTQVVNNVDATQVVWDNTFKVHYKTGASEDWDDRLMAEDSEVPGYYSAMMDLKAGDILCVCVNNYWHGWDARNTSLMCNNFEKESEKSNNIRCTADGSYTIYGSDEDFYIKDNTPAPEYHYYLVGVIGGEDNWDSTDIELIANPDKAGEYYLADPIALKNGDAIKAMDGTNNYYPDAADKKWEITEDGNYRVYFRPDQAGGEGWYEGYLYVQKQETPSTDVYVVYKNGDTDHPIALIQSGDAFTAKVTAQRGDYFTATKNDEAFALTAVDYAGNNVKVLNDKLTVLTGDAQEVSIWVHDDTTVWLDGYIQNEYFLTIGENAPVQLTKNEEPGKEYEYLVKGIGVKAGDAISVMHDQEAFAISRKADENNINTIELSIHNDCDSADVYLDVVGDGHPIWVSGYQETPVTYTYYIEQIHGDEVGAKIPLVKSSAEDITASGADDQYEYEYASLVGGDYIKFYYSTDGGSTYTQFSNIITIEDGQNLNYTTEAGKFVIIADRGSATKLYLKIKNDAYSLRLDGYQKVINFTIGGNQVALNENEYHHYVGSITSAGTSDVWKLEIDRVEVGLNAKGDAGNNVVTNDKVTTVIRPIASATNVDIDPYYWIWCDGYYDLYDVYVGESKVASDIKTDAGLKITAEAGSIIRLKANGSEEFANIYVKDGEGNNVKATDDPTKLLVIKGVEAGEDNNMWINAGGNIWLNGYALEYNVQIGENHYIMTKSEESEKGTDTWDEQYKLLAQNVTAGQVLVFNKDYNAKMGISGASGNLAIDGEGVITAKTTFASDIYLKRYGENWVVWASCDNAYYLRGGLNGWDSLEDYRFTKCTGEDEKVDGKDQYYLLNVVVAGTGDALKFKGFSIDTYYPDGNDLLFPSAGTYDIYFAPAGGVSNDAWKNFDSRGYFYIRQHPVATSLAVSYAGGDIVVNSPINSLNSLTITVKDQYGGTMEEFLGSEGKEGVTYLVDGVAGNTVTVIKNNTVITVQYLGLSNTFKVNVIEQVIPATGLAIRNGEEEYASGTLFMGETLTLNCAFTPANTTQAELLAWKSSDETVATVANGVVTPVKEGTVTITAFIDLDQDGVLDEEETVRDTCQVTVEYKYTITIGSKKVQLTKSNNVDQGYDEKFEYVGDELDIAKDETIAVRIAGEDKDVNPKAGDVLNINNAVKVKVSEESDVLLTALATNDVQAYILHKNDGDVWEVWLTGVTFIDAYRTLVFVDQEIDAQYAFEDAYDELPGEEKDNYLAQYKTTFSIAANQEFKMMNMYSKDSVQYGCYQQEKDHEYFENTINTVVKSKYAGQITAYFKVANDGNNTISVYLGFVGANYKLQVGEAPQTDLVFDYNGGTVQFKKADVALSKDQTFQIFGPDGKTALGLTPEAGAEEYISYDGELKTYTVLKDCVVDIYAKAAGSVYFGVHSTAETNYKVLGIGGDWEYQDSTAVLVKDKGQLPEGVLHQWSLQIELAEDATIKINDGSKEVWIGYSAIEEGGAKANFAAGESDNIVVNAGGIYKIYLKQYSEGFKLYIEEVAPYFDFTGKVITRFDNDGGKIDLGANSWAANYGHEAHAEVTKPCSDIWRAGMFINTGVTMTAGKTYRVTFDVSHATEGAYNVILQCKQWTDEGKTDEQRYAFSNLKEAKYDKQFTVTEANKGSLWILVEMGSEVNEVTISNLNVVEVEKQSVTFKATCDDVLEGEALYVVGDFTFVDETAWKASEAYKMIYDNTEKCYKLTIQLLPRAAAYEYKFVRAESTNPATYAWETIENNRTFTVSDAAVVENEGAITFPSRPEPQTEYVVNIWSKITIGNANVDKPAYAWIFTNNTDGKWYAATHVAESWETETNRHYTVNLGSVDPTGKKIVFVVFSSVTDDTPNWNDKIVQSADGTIAYSDSSFWVDANPAS